VDADRHPLVDGGNERWDDRPNLRRMTHFDDPDAIYIDANGCLAERVELDGFSVVMHYDDVPDSDLTTVDGLPCTTALRAVLDVAASLDEQELYDLVAECLARGLFTPDEAFDRIAAADMLSRAGAMDVARTLVDLGHLP
jgi:hypothetical protein